MEWSERKLEGAFFDSPKRILHKITAISIETIENTFLELVPNCLEMLDGGWIGTFLQRMNILEVFTEPLPLYAAVATNFDR